MLLEYHFFELQSLVSNADFMCAHDIFTHIIFFNLTTSIFFLYPYNNLILILYKESANSSSNCGFYVHQISKAKWKIFQEYPLHIMLHSYTAHNFMTGPLTLIVKRVFNGNISMHSDTPKSRRHIGQKEKNGIIDLKFYQ